jgi:hypothetical protein
MATPLQEDDHYLLRKLCHEILPWMIGGRRATKQWFVLFATIYACGGEVATAVAGLGIGSPIVAPFQGKTTNENTFEAFRQALQGPWFWIGVVALGLWLALRITVKQLNATDRALFARECNRTIQKLYIDLYDALADPNPLPKIVPIQEALRRVFREAIDKGVWPWDPLQPPNLEPELGRQVADIPAKFMRGWEPPPTGVA